MPWLKIVQGEGRGRLFRLDQQVTVLGRDASCEIVLADPGVSKRHARIVRQGDGYFIEDLQSTNGTKVGDDVVAEARHLEDGDLITIGDTQLVFSETGSTILSVLDASSTDDGRISRARPQEKLQAILEIARALGGTIDLDAVLAGVLDALFRILPQAHRGFILLKGDETGDLILRASKRRESDTVSATFSRTIFEHVISQGQALLCEDIGFDDRFRESASIKESQIRTVLCVPLWDRHRQPVGVLQVDTQDEHGRFDEDDLELLLAVAGPVSVAIENARLHQIAVKQADLEREARDARAVQFALIPDRTPDLPGYEFWHYYEPARHVGGDYFDYVPIPAPGAAFEEPRGRWAIAIGDVTGKGMPAALLMTRLSSEVGLLLQIEPDPARLVERLNRNLSHSRTDEKFITFLIAILDGHRQELTVVNAGHMDPLIRRAAGPVEAVGHDEAGPPLGIIDEQPFKMVTAPISPGDVVVLYTDGVNEALDSAGRLFGIERVRQALASAPAGAGDVGRAILDAVRRHAVGCAQSDDIALVCFGRT
jgi:serine phosphatase RsbU (regulator of sigma subunit)/pSer/pThr/pTyr-binding forkhead associated (FHA) protein